MYESEYEYGDEPEKLSLWERYWKLELPWYVQAPGMLLFFWLWFQVARLIEAVAQGIGIV